MSPERRSEIARRGNAKLREQGKVHQYNSQTGKEAVAKRADRYPSAICPVCNEEVKQVSSATLGLAVSQHILWMHGVEEYKKYGNII